MKRYHTMPKRILTDYEISMALKKHESIIRKAILFAIGSKIPPKEIESLTWQSVKKYPLDRDALYILESLPRHLFCNLIFWRTRKQAPEPIIGLKDICDEMAYPNTWQEYLELTERILLVKDSAEDFIEQIVEQTFYDF